MADLHKVVATWSGGKIGTGFTNLYFSFGVSTAQACADAVRVFFNDAYTIGAHLPAGITISFAGGVDIIDETTGQLLSTTPVTPPASLTGSDSGNYAALAGGCVNWLTNGVVGGRRVRGRTFLVPVGSSGLQSDGTISSNFVTALNSAGANLITAAPELAVWHRPTTPGGTDGKGHPVLAHRVRDTTVFLTSRR